MTIWKDVKEEMSYGIPLLVEYKDYMNDTEYDIGILIHSIREKQDIFHSTCYNIDVPLYHIKRWCYMRDIK